MLSMVSRDAGRPHTDWLVGRVEKLPMQDPEFVQCSACVQSRAPGALQSGDVGRGGQRIRVDSLSASPMLAREGAQ